VNVDSDRNFHAAGANGKETGALTEVYDMREYCAFCREKMKRWLIGENFHTTFDSMLETENRRGQARELFIYSYSIGNTTGRTLKTTLAQDGTSTTEEAYRIAISL